MLCFPSRWIRQVLLLALLTSFSFPTLAKESKSTADVIVYGATSAGVTAAISAARNGANVILLEPGRHVGGMLSGGLGRTDMDRQENVIGGLAKEFFQRVGRHYGQEVAWIFEPHVAEDVLKGMLSEQKIDPIFGQALGSITMKNGQIESLKTRDGHEYSARVFIDATYEGDLMKAAKVSYAMGRESRSLHGESLAGRRDLLRSNHQINVRISPWKDGKLLPHVTAEEDLVPTGTGDGKMQAYCFRLCLTDVPENRLPVTPPPHYNPDDYELLRRCFEVGGEQVDGILGIKRMPNGKSDVNAGAPISLNLPGANQE
ncbi:MAG: FAD-dependent oxidoreductase, partial [Verrucomicrobia bacterium]|nr:FAD-dependent oxidoreductase [Verrucomicrobiota bacterium]